ncbi:protein crumbs [Pieris rapae]|uniref:protein crumbs n=1 Tax=Pieris rapae TaxID=64459 RepID=UPI001E27CEA1|nr:protein crumbs [Pieris rapae]
MKVDLGVWRRRNLSKLAAGCVVILFAFAQSEAATPLGPSDRPEAYFNGSSYIRLSRPISLKQLVGLSYRTCVGGELFSQRSEGYTLHVTALFEQVVVSWSRPGQPQREVGIAKETLDNRWHWVALKYRPNPPALLLEVDRESQVISNVTWNGELLSAGALEANGAVVLVGNVFSGCLHEGPQLEFHAAYLLQTNVRFGHCPLTTDECKDRKDVLRIPPKDHCYNEPCMRHGTCISRHDRYECHCSARYTGNNCEVDAGDPCASAPCHHGGTCVEDTRGDYTCLCPKHYHGMFCELEDSLDPQCVAGPCRNNGSCSVPTGADSYVCDCLPGYTGRNCETDIDECAISGAACLNGGRCVDAVNNYTCDCTNTGYTGPRCDININECLEERSVCGHGVCYDTYGSFVCACLPGYTGDRCQKMSACASGPCGVGGACVEENNGAGFRCVCARGLAPPLCVPQAPPTTVATPSSSAPSTLVTPVSACEEVSCPPRSHCRQGVTGMVAGIVLTKQVLCVCDIGYYGAPGVSPNCSTLESVCESGVCQNGGTCTRTPEHFNCTCPPPYRGMYCEVGPSGKALSEPKVERCASVPCLHSTGCRDTPNGFRCDCEAGWTGARCEVNMAPALSGDCGRGCANGGTCRGTECDCRPGFGGPYCEVTLDCRATPCPHRQECVEQSGTWRCAAAGAESACSSSPCHNGTCLALDNGLFRCQCQPGHTGRFCEIDIDECALMPKICNHGVCVNIPGSYQCYCKPGYTGDSCEQDIDECLSTPCKNGGSCQNLENNYECTCVEGFEGKDCSININECATNPCAAGATCVDGIASYSCLCPEGLTGARCQIDIDDCESEPCLHGGYCADGVNSFTCDCTGTGYNGPTCETNIDECAPQPCRNAATCIDDLNDYHCMCHPGFTGKNCEIDIEECESNPCKYDGVCLERSNTSLYRTPESPPVQVGPQPHMLLPQVFYQPFSLENAGGFECVCVTGTTGARCEINIDECESSPCGHGKCVDGIGEYRCECAPGYEGDHCEIEIDECLRYAPCAHGRCYDGHASYMCLCEPGWGGRNCSVVLRGCADSPCANRGNCLPWLANETDHRFNCSCAPGFYGTTCEKITTMSLEKSSFVEVNTSREEGYDISFRFKTTLGNGLLAMGRGLTYFFLELSNGRLNLHSSLLNKWEGVFIGSNLNDSNWQKVFVTINSSHVVLSANEEQTIYPISQNEAFNATVTSFPSTRLGTTGSSYGTLTHGPNFFVGCFQDVVVNQHWVLPEDSNTTMPEFSTERVGSDWGEKETEETETEMDPEGQEDEGPRVVLRGVLASCPRTPQCEPNPCHSGGHCEDAWTTFVCSCPRPYLGHTCQYNYTAATFGQESARPHSVVVVNVSEAARRAVHAALDISMFVRTRKPTGQIFYLGSGSSRYGGTDETLVAASLKGGELLVHLRFNHTPEDYTVGGTRLDNGHLHLIQVVRNSTLVQVKLNGTEYFRKSISAAKQLDAQILYLGGPPTPILPTESTLLPNTTQAPIPEPDDSEYFKGVIQDVQISNGLNATIVEFFPLRVEGVSLPPPFGEVELDPSGVLEGVVSDDVCASTPCHHNATCTNTWNDYMCTCPRGYKGKQCDEVEFCQLQGCPLNSHCRNLDRGYECVSNATFDGVNTTLTYTLRTPAADALAEPIDPPQTLTLTYRSKVGGTLFRAELDESEQDSEKNTTNGISWFSVGVYRGQAALQWRLGGLPALRTLRTRNDALHWTTLRLTFVDQQIKGAFIDGEGREEVTLTDSIDVAAWQRLVTRGVITLGGVGHARTRPHPTATTYMTDNTTETVWEYSEGDEFDDNLNGEYFKGCLGAVHVGGLLLPYFTEEELFVGAAAALLAAQPYYALLSGSPWGWSEGVGCVLCLEQECQRGAHCEDVRNSYSCACPAGYAGDYCQIDIDECENNQCQNGATCKDDVAKYLCLCPNGYDGVFCEHDIDECETSPCANGARCIDLPGAFQCECGSEWTGPRCQRPKHRSCAHTPCAHATCTDVYDASSGNNYTCTCEEGWTGVHCEQALCEIEHCEHGICNTTISPPSCWCEEGFAGRRCEREVDVCATGHTCEHNARCRTSNGRALCDCPPEWRGAHCEIDVDECLEQRVDCGPGVCRNLPGSYTCECEAGLCGDGCALPDPCYEVYDEGGANRTGPCLNGGDCTQRCTNVTDYICDCTHPASGKDCAQLLTTDENEGADTTTILLAVGGALLGALILGGVIAVLATQARRKRATRGTYSPSGQEYCNPRAEMMHNALKPPPEERLI